MNEPDPLCRCDAWSMPARNPRTRHTCPGEKRWSDNCYPFLSLPILPSLHAPVRQHATVENSEVSKHRNPTSITKSLSATCSKTTTLIPADLRTVPAIWSHAAPLHFSFEFQLHRAAAFGRRASLRFVTSQNEFLQSAAEVSATYSSS